MGHFRPFLFFYVKGANMKGYYNTKTKYPRSKYAKTYNCKHPLYQTCTLFMNGDLGLAVVQKRFNESQRIFWWGAIDPWIADDMYISELFNTVFSRLARPADENGFYPTVTVRKLMYALGMKPLKKAYWEMEL